MIKDILVSHKDCHTITYQGLSHSVILWGYAWNHTDSRNLIDGINYEKELNINIMLNVLVGRENQMAF